MAFLFLSAEGVARITEALTPYFLGTEQQALVSTADVIGDVISDDIAGDIDNFYEFMSDIQSTAGADMVGITDLAGHFTGTSVEDALQELGTNKLNASAVSAYGLTLVDDANAAAARSTLGLGTAATSNAGDFATAGHTHSNATTGAAGFMSAADKTKLDGVATGATANATDAQLRDRSTHTGTQAASTISDFSEAVDDRVGSLLLAGSGITLTYNDAGNLLTIAATGGGGSGTVTSVAVSDGGTGISVSGSPVTTSGTITLTLSTNLQNWSGIATTRLGRVPITDSNANYTFVAGDAGNARRKTNTTAYDYTVNTGVHSQDDVITVVNNGSAGNITIVQGSGVTLRLGGTTTTGSRTVAPYGVAYIYFQSSTEAIVSGAGVT